MAPSRTRSRSNPAAPDFDPYDPKYDPHYGGPDFSQRRKTMPTVTPLTDDESDYRSDYAGKRSHSMPAKKAHKRKTKKADDGWDTDYDPLDKYYLSDEGEFVDHRSPTGVIPKYANEAASSKSRNGQHRERHHRRSTHHSSDDEKPRRSSHHHDTSNERRHRSHHREERERERSRERSRHHSRDDDIDHERRRRDDSSRRSTRHHSSSRDHNPEPDRRRPLERENSFDRPRSHSTHPAGSRSSHRPKLTARSSSFDGRHSKPKYPPSASRSRALHRQSLHEHSKNTAKTMDFPWSQAAQCAMRAGAMAALKVGSEPGPWIGMKGGKVASAAIGAAVVDGFMAQRDTLGVRAGGMRHSTMRHLTELAFANMVAKPAVKTFAGNRRK